MPSKNGLCITYEAQSTTQSTRNCPPKCATPVFLAAPVPHKSLGLGVGPLDNITFLPSLEHCK